jgi:hypothetical protein
VGEIGVREARSLGARVTLPLDRQGATSAGEIDRVNALTILSFYTVIYEAARFSLCRLYEIALAPISISYAPAGKYPPRVKAKHYRR